jgi:hypothetical protein
MDGTFPITLFPIDKFMAGIPPLPKRRKGRGDGKINWRKEKLKNKNTKNHIMILLDGVLFAFCFILDHIDFHPIRGFICSNFDVLTDVDCSGILNKCIKEASDVTFVFH